ncbi:transposable element Tcb2 transposase [Trichonephila clavipes]|nr:transposable element Tcb2 transposase [Trichonephila clavipes]
MGGAISWRGLGPLVTLHGKVKAAHYVNILRDQVHPFVQTSFPGECSLYQVDNAPIHTAKIVQEWFAEHEGEIGHLDWPSQSPDLNIIEHLWGYLESKLRARFPPPSTISTLDTALYEEWLHIPLQVFVLFYHPSVDAQEKRNEENVIDDFIPIMDSLIKEFSAKFSQFKELSETFKFIMFPDVISFDKLNLSQFDWLEIEELEMQLIDFQSSSIWIQKFIETRKKLELIEAERLTRNIS